MFCQYCGKAIQDGLTTCLGCGNPVVPLETELRRPVVITILAILQLFSGVLCVLAAVAFSLTSMSTKNVSALLAIVFCVIGALNFICGYGLWNLKSYGRTIQLILACIGLIAIPLGTIISVLIVIYLHRPGVKILFSMKNWNELMPQEKIAVSTIHKPGAVVVAVVAAVFFFFAVVYLGIIAAIAIPNFINAMQRGKQKRTIADIRAIMTAVEEYRTNNGFYPTADSMPKLGRLLEPAYMEAMPCNDGWGHVYQYRAWKENETSPGIDSYALVSAGRDGAWEQNDPRAYSEKAPASFEADIVLVNGAFVQTPERSTTSGN